MIDKIWYDWQKKGLKNKYSYEGGSVTALPNYRNYTIYPTGLPPFLNVGVPSNLNESCLIIASHTFRSLHSLIVRSLVMVYGTLQFGM